MIFRAVTLPFAVWLAACTSTTSNQGGASGGPSGTVPGDSGPGTGDADLLVEPAVEIGPGWLRGIHPEDLPEDTHVIGAAAHEDPAEARARAVIALEAALWGPVADRPRFFSLPEVLGKGATVLEEPLADGRTAVRVAVLREEVGARIDDWLDETIELAPAAVEDEPQARIAAAIAGQERRILEIWGCERRRSVARAECEPATGGNSPLRVAARWVQLRPALEGGIPRFPEQPPLRGAGVRLLWQRQDGSLVPWTGVRLLFSAGEGVLDSDSCATNEHGYAEVGFAAEPGDAPIVVTLDAEALFGKLAGEWPETRASLTLREVTRDNLRVGVHLFEQISQEPTDEGTTTRATVAKLIELGYDNALVLPGELAATLAPAREGRFAAAVGKLSAAAAGRADVLVMGEVYSDFLSRAVGRSVWHEAIVHAKVYDLWTGRHLGDAQRETRAKGMGDFNAARKAMKTLGEDLAVAIRDLLTEQKLTAGGAETETLATR